MKLNKNTMVPKCIKMRSEIEIIKKTIEQIVGILNSKDSIEFAGRAEKFINNFPKVEYFNEEMESIKECIIDVFDGYETRDNALLYMRFMDRVVENTLDYLDGKN